MRDTATGDVLERMVLPALAQAGFAVERQVRVGSRPGGGKHMVDIVARPAAGRAILVSLKWQQTGGTAEQKVPFEVICLAEALRAAPLLYERAYLVLGGAGWKLRDFYTKGGLRPHLVHADLVRILDLEQFVADANRGRL